GWSDRVLAPRLLIGRRHQDGVDQVDHRVGGLDSAANNLGVIDHQVVAASGHLQVLAFNGGVSSCNVCGLDFPGNYVIGEHLGQHVRILDDRVQVFFRNGREGLVNRCEDREFGAVQGVDQVDVRVQLSGDRFGQGLQQ